MQHSPVIFDRALLDARRLRAATAGLPTGSDFLLAHVAGELVDRLSLVERHFELAVELAGHSGLTAGLLRQGNQCGAVLRTERLPALLDSDPFGVVADDEALPFAAASVDLVVSPLALQFTNDTPGALVQIQRMLRPDGLFLGALLGGETLSELRQALAHAEIELYGGVSPRVAPFVDVRDAGALLQRAGFALPVADQDRLTVRYDSLFDLVRDLRSIGMGNMLVERNRKPVSRRFFLRAAESYAERFADADGRIRATFDVVYLSGWRPHESQQRPLRPGSARASLAEALKDRSSDYTSGRPKRTDS